MLSSWLRECSCDGDELNYSSELTLSVLEDVVDDSSVVFSKEVGERQQKVYSSV